MRGKRPQKETKETKETKGISSAGRGRVQPGRSRSRIGEPGARSGRNRAGFKCLTVIHLIRACVTAGSNLLDAAWERRAGTTRPTSRLTRRFNRRCARAQGALRAAK